MSIDFKSPVPLYRQIINEIKDDIGLGRLVTGAQISSNQELAQYYNVSLITVKKAISELIGEGILFSRAGKGTYVARKPSDRRLIQSHSIGVVLRDLSSPFFSLVVKGVQHRASCNGYNVLVSSTADEVEREESQILHFREMGVAGLVIASMTHVYNASPTLRTLHEEDFPYVMVSYMADRDIYHVGTDHEEGGFVATKHLIDCGYSRIGYVNGETGNMVGDLRKKGYERAFIQSGKHADEKFHYRLRLRGEWNDFRSGFEVGEYIASLDDKPDALFVYNDLAALGVEQALLNARIRIPHDIALIGFDDIGQDELARVPLSTVRQPTFEIGIRAVDMIMKRLAGEDVEVRTELKPELILRKSCGTHLRRSVETD